MELQKLNADIPFDIIAQDRNGKTILLVEVKARHLENRQHKDWFIERVISYLQATNADSQAYNLLSTLPSSVAS